MYVYIYTFRKVCIDASQSVGRGNFKRGDDKGFSGWPMPELFLVDDFYRPTKFPSIRSNDHRSLEGVAIRETRIDEDNFDENGGKNYFNILGAYARMIAREITFSSAVVPFITKPLSLSLSLCSFDSKWRQEMEALVSACLFTTHFVSCRGGCL